MPIINERWNWGYMGPSPDRFLPILACMHRSVTGATPPVAPVRRVYVTRGAGLHRVLRNGIEIERIFRSYGFAIVDPVNLTFAEQAALMASADVVAGPEGSAMFLNFYRRPGTKLLILSHPFTRHVTNWTATLEARGIETAILTGPAVPMAEAELAPAARFGYNYFIDYEIEPAKLFEALVDLGIA